MSIFNEYDIKLMNFISSYKVNFDKIQKESLKYKFDINKEAFESRKISATDKSGKKYVFEFIPFGGIHEGYFNWYRDINKSLYASLLKTNIDPLKKQTFQKLFNNDKLLLEKKHLKVIPYLLSILLSDYNVIEATTPDKKSSIFFLTNTRLKDTFDYNNFFNKYDHSNVTAKQRRTSRKKKN